MSPSDSPPFFTQNQLNALAIPETAKDVLEFWLITATPKQWFVKDADFDSLLKDKFLDTVRHGGAGAFEEWVYGTDATAESALAYIILLDQFPRNLFRDDAEAHAYDAKALAAAKHAIAAGWHNAFLSLGRIFYLMPLEHSEMLEDQDLCIALMKPMADALGNPEFYEYAIKHRDVIAKFGRFPHRNKMLGRTSTAEEAAYLAKPGAGF